MSARYVNIQLFEMKEFLREDKGWKQGVTGREISFEYQLKNHPWLVIKVCTGIRVGDNQSRDCGKDALRVYCVNTALNKGWIATKTCYRVGSWRQNLQAKIMEVITEAKQRR